MVAGWSMLSLPYVHSAPWSNPAMNSMLVLTLVICVPCMQPGGAPGLCEDRHDRRQWVGQRGGEHCRWADGWLCNAWKGASVAVDGYVIDS